jgi:excisionase family DNA binding protein
MLSVRQAAERAGVSVSLVYAWCAAGSLKHSRFGRPGRRGTIRVEESDLGAFLERCRREERLPAAPPQHLRHITLPQPS